MSDPEPSSLPPVEDSPLVLKRLSRLTKVSAFGLLGINVYGLFEQIYRAMTGSSAAGWFGLDFDTVTGAVTTVTGLFVIWMLFSYRPEAPRRPLIPEKADDDQAIRRKRDAKRFNERLKLASAFLNAIGASSFLALVVIPVLSQKPAIGTPALYGLLIALVCHLLGQGALTLWKTEE